MDQATQWDPADFGEIYNDEAEINKPLPTEPPKLTPVAPSPPNRATLATNDVTGPKPSKGPGPPGPPEPPSGPPPPPTPDKAAVVKSKFGCKRKPRGIFKGIAWKKIKIIQPNSVWHKIGKQSTYTEDKKIFEQLESSFADQSKTVSNLARKGRFRNDVK